MNPNPQEVKAFKATGIITPNRVVKLSGDFSVALGAANTDDGIGISRPLMTTPIGQLADVIIGGIADVVCGGTVTGGKPQMCDANGAIIDKTSTNRQIGIALRSGVAGDIVPMRVVQA